MPEGGPLDYAHWRVRYWLPATRAVGLPWLTFHDLRRANATALVTAGIDLKTAQTRLGHSDPRLTLAVYAQATTAADRDAADRVAALFQATPAEAEAEGVNEDECAMDVPWALPRAPPRGTRKPPTSTFVVGKGGFEPPASASRTLRANQAALLPGPGHASRRSPWRLQGEPACPAAPRGKGRGQEHLHRGRHQPARSRLPEGLDTRSHQGPRPFLFQHPANPSASPSENRGATIWSPNGTPARPDRAAR